MPSPFALQGAVGARPIKPHNRTLHSVVERLCHLIRQPRSLPCLEFHGKIANSLWITRPIVDFDEAFPVWVASVDYLQTQINTV